MDPSDTPTGNGNGHAAGAGAGTGGDAVDPEQAAAVMIEQLTDMLAGWERQALALAERGVDPRPLLAALAANLHTVADQLVADPDRDAEPEPEPGPDRPA
jgi:hypothetical protein